MFKSRWWVVVASFLALIVGQGPIMIFGSGVFIKPLAHELHFSRGMITSAMGLANIVVAVTVPFVGRMLDRRGFRPVLLPLLCLFAVTTAALSLLQSSVVVLFLLFAIQGLGGAAGDPPPYAKMITLRFDDLRGLALGITLAGVGFGTALLPQFSRFLLQHVGWRMGYVGLGGAMMVLAFVPVAIWFGEPVEGKLPGERSRPARQDLPGVEFSEAVRSGKYWAITIALTLWCAVVSSSVVHVVPLLTDRGLTLAKAVDIMSTVGLAVIGGRFLAGYLLDKFFASYVAAVVLLCPMVGIALLGFGVRGAGTVVGVILLGLGMGADHDLLAFLISRYFGTKAFATIHGFSFSITLIAVAVGVSLLGWSYTLMHSYNPGFVLFEGFLAIAIFLLIRLGPYRYPAVKPSVSRAPKAVAAHS